MHWIWLLLIGATSGWLLAVLSLSLWTWWRPKADAVHFATTSDGFRLAMHELKPATPNGSRPVILCHGILMSRHCWLPPEGVPSLAESLRARGYRCFVVELRGSGMSTRSWNYGFLDYADRDVEALVAEVRRITGAESVDWVGHSMGGLVGYAHLARHGPGAIHKMVTLGSPVILGRAINRIPAISIVPSILKLSACWNFSRSCKATAPFLLWGGAPWVEQFINVRGMSRRFAIGVKTWGIQATSTKLLCDFFGWHSATGPLLPRVAGTPGPYPEPPGGLLALYGGVDYMAPARAVTPLPQWFPGAQVESIDPPGRPFGHLDLLAGPKEVEVVAERLHRFLAPVEVTSSLAR